MIMFFESLFMLNPQTKRLSMKKSRLLLMCAVLILASASCGNDGEDDSGILDGKDAVEEAQSTLTDARKMLANGRTWNYMSVYFNSPAPDTVYHSITIEGPVEFDGKQCYRRSNASQEDTNPYFYEEGDKVYAYKIVDDYGQYGWNKEFDFGIEPGYKETYSMDDITIVTRECKSVDTVVVNGVQRRRLNFGDDIWVEGIGSSKSGIYADWGTVPGSFMGSKLLSVYDGEKCIFTAADISIAGVNKYEENPTALEGAWHLVKIAGGDAPEREIPAGEVTLYFYSNHTLQVINKEETKEKKPFMESGFYSYEIIKTETSKYDNTVFTTINLDGRQCTCWFRDDMMVLDYGMAYDAPGYFFKKLN